MTDAQYQQLIAVMYDENAQTNAVGLLTGQLTTWAQIGCLLLLIVVFFLALRRAS